MTTYKNCKYQKVFDAIIDNDKTQLKKYLDEDYPVDKYASFYASIMSHNEILDILVEHGCLIYFDYFIKGTTKYFIKIKEKKLKIILT